MSHLVISKSDRRAMTDAMRHMLAAGAAARDVRRGMNLSIRQMPRDVYLPSGHAKGLKRRARP